MPCRGSASVLQSECTTQLSFNIVRLHPERVLGHYCPHAKNGTPILEGWSVGGGHPMWSEISTSTPENFSIVDCLLEDPIWEKAVVMYDHVRNGEVCLVSDRT